MRQIQIAVMAAASLVAVGMIYSPPATAMTVGATPAGLSVTTADIELVMTASCFRQGWHGLGNYPSCDKPAKKKRPKPRRKE
jgi:hypothetical protein